MSILGTVSTELVFSHPQGRTWGEGIVPPECLAHLEAERERYGVRTRWLDEAGPTAGRKRRSFKPIEGGRLALIEGSGIRHGERFCAIFAVKQVRRNGTTQRQFWLVGVERLARAS
jgi:hypothetical protein